MTFLINPHNCAVPRHRCSAILLVAVLCALAVFTQAQQKTGEKTNGGKRGTLVEAASSLRRSAAASQGSTGENLHQVGTDIAISDVTLLLPFVPTKTKVSKIIEAYNGCFKWSSSDPEVVTVTPLYDVADQTGTDVASASGEKASRQSRHTESPLDTSSKKCSTRAVVTSQSAFKERKATWVIAEDILTARKLRCEVFVDQISKIDILTTTRSMYREDIEVLTIQAFDAEGNLFSSTEGLAFRWSILPEPLTTEGPSAAESSTVLKIVPFRESAIEVSPMLLKMEDEGRMGDAILVQGIDTGKCRVAARLVEPGYQHVSMATVPLAVFEPLQLFPSHTLFVARYAKIQYTLHRLLHGDTFKPIDMPSPFYRWFTTNTTVATVDNHGCTRALQHGHTDVVVQYVNLTENEAKGAVYVVPPAYLQLTVMPAAAPADADAAVTAELAAAAGGRPVATGDTASSNWYLISGWSYVVEVDVYSRDGHKLSFTDNLRFRVTFEDKRLQVVDSTANHGRHRLIAGAPGDTEIVATLYEVTDSETGRTEPLSPPIIVRQDVVITAPVSIAPRGPVVLPCCDVLRHQFSLNATGGTGEYTWYVVSGDSDAISVNAAGVLTALSLGEATVIAADRKNPLNRDRVWVISSAPATVGFRPREVEVQVGHSLILPVVARDEHGRIFDNCSALPLTWELSTVDVFALLTNHTTSDQRRRRGDGSCAEGALLALREGHTTVTVRYGTALHAEQMVFAFRPLRLVLPAEPAGALVTVGAAAQWVFDGGPNPWFYEPAAYFEEIRPEDPSAVRFAKAGQVLTNHHSYLVTCLRVHSQNITVVVGNRPTPTNPLPATLSATARLTCDSPYVLLILPDSAGRRPALALQENAASGSVDTVDTAPICPDAAVFPSPAALMALMKAAELVNPIDTAIAAAAPTQYMLRNARRVGMNVVVVDKRWHAFTNFSSLAIDWSTSDAALAALAPATSAYDWRFVDLGDTEGRVTVRAAVTGYDPRVLAAADIAMSTVPALSVSTPRLSRSLELQLVANARLSPNHVALYNHEQNIARLRIAGGSGTFAFSVNTSDVAQVTHVPGSSTVDVQPVGSGVALVTAIDVCLEGAEPAHSVVAVSEIAALRLLGNELVRLDDVTVLDVEAFDELGESFEPSQMKLMNFTVNVDTPSVLAVSLAQTQRGGPVSYAVRGISTGEATVVVCAEVRPSRTRMSTPVCSPPKPVYVYPPLRADPQKLLLLPTAIFQIRWTGGPPFGAAVRFACDNTSVVTVDDAGRVSAEAVGHTRIVVVAEGYGPIGERIVYGRDEVHVTVRQLEGIRLHGNSNKLLVGREMAVHVVGTNGESPLSFSGIDLVFEWEAANTAAVTLLPIYERPNVTIETERSFSARVAGKAPGQSRVQVRLVVTADTPPAVFAPAVLHGTTPLTASFVVTVIEPLHLLSPPSLLLPPYWQSQILTNKDHSARLSYTLLSPYPCTANWTPVITVDETGRIVAGGTTGEAVIHIREDDGELGQSQLVHVAVRAVQQLQLLPAATSLPRVLPVGSALEVAIHLRDSLGNGFTPPPAATAPSGWRADQWLDWRISDLDVADAQLGGLNASVVVKALRTGSAVLRVAVTGGGSPSLLEDFVRIEVAHAILPYEPTVHMGGLVLFTTSFAARAANTARSDVWSTDNPGVLAVEPSTGAATARAVGKAHVFHNTTDLYTFTTVEVVKIAEIRLDAAGVPLLTNVPRDSTYRMRVAFVDSAGRVFAPPPVARMAPYVNHNIEFRCVVSDTLWAFAESVTVPGDGYYCVVSPKTPHWTDARNRPPMIGALRLTVVASDTAGNYEVSTSHTFDFQPAFIVAADKHVRLSSNRKSALVEVYARRGAAIEASTSDQLRVQVTLKDVIRDTAGGDTHIFEIAAVERRIAFDDVAVTIASYDTGQKETVLVSYIPVDTAASLVRTRDATERVGSEVGGFGPQAPTGSQLSWFFLGVLTVALAIATYLFFAKLFAEPQAAVASRSPLSPPRPPGGGGNDASFSPPPSPGFQHHPRSPFAPR